mgnify:CR=1 FL=1|jgi:hypothetical protein
MIQIRNQTKITEMYKFVHPVYKDVQKLFFNKNADVMIEWLSHNRVLLYTKQVIGKDANDEKVL